MLGAKWKSQKRKETYYFLQDMLFPSKKLHDKGPIKWEQNFKLTISRVTNQ